MDLGTYFTLQISNVPSAMEEQITFELFEAGASGVQENLQFTQMDKNYKPHVIEAEVKSLIVYFEKVPSSQWLEHFQSHYPFLQVQQDKHQIVDWLKQWKEQWQPFELITDVWIVPEWHRQQFQPPGQGRCIFIEPGMAFGTGTHATTQIAGELLSQLLQNQKVKSLVDVGTGSGILSFLASFFEVPSIFAYDNDDESKRVFHENLIKNPNPAIQWQEQWSSQLAGKVDVTLANIIDGVLLMLKPEFQKVDSQYYIFTGILVEREKDFLEEMRQDWNLETIARLEKQEWVGFVMKRDM